MGDNGFMEGFMSGQNSTNRNNDSFFGGGQWMWIIVVFALLFGWGNRGNNQAPIVLPSPSPALEGALTRGELATEFGQNDIKNGIRTLTDRVSDSFATNNTAMLAGFNGVDRQLCQGFAGVNAGLAENRFAAQQCCCETQRAIDAVRAENYKNTCEITTALHAEGEATRGMIAANQLQELRDKLADRDRDLLAANFNASQVAQTAQIIGVLQPTPRPAYITCSPYAAYSTNMYTGCNSGCAACNG